MDGLLGVTDLARAAATGYIVDRTGSDPGDVGDPINDLSAEERLALELAFNGPDSSRTVEEVRDSDGSVVGGYELGDGCLANFYSSFVGSLEAFGAFMAADLRLQDGLNRARDLLAADSAYVAAQQEWSQCVQRAGYSFSTPFDPLSRQ